MLAWDVALLTLTHKLIATNAPAFFAVLFLADRVPLVISTMVLVALWFSGQPDGTSQQPARLTQRESRQRVLLILFSMVAAFFLAQVIGDLFFRPRPLVDLPLQVPIDPQIWTSIVDQLRNDGGFPSQHAAFWFALTAGLFTFDWRAGLAAGLISLFFSALRMGLGYNYPSDTIAGACLGILTCAGIFSIRQKLAWLILPTFQFFRRNPILAYPFGLLVMIDITQRMRWLFGLLAILFGGRGPSL